MHQAPSRAWMMVWLPALPLLLGCAERKASTAGPDSPTQGGTASSTSSSSSPQCPSGGPSVSVNVRGYSGGPELPRETLATTLSWIGSFAQPCLEASPEAPQFKLAITIPEAGQAPTFELVDRDSLPGLAACLDEHFASAAAPPPEPMLVEITIPWGCPTLGPA
ncbi:hypothetical protein [Paraliomyxa miuraensis]|uniref:hypothetical protein n=1 Tax=Paraliomyxa miuraensis TaxID=376150 RepID=UPI00225C2A6A|nr:hypothetical protein [Paraliomyxa miuraensis]MCX4239377.1 hypothetical protein [Paraliomyxa miuraensis]